jgi:hypothetical protein
MYSAKLVSFGMLLSLFGAGAFGQNCRPGSVEFDVNIQCSCVKDPNGDTCKLYQRSKSMYDGKGIEFPKSLAPTATAPAPARVPQPGAGRVTAAQDRTPVSATLLPAGTPFWQMLPAGVRMAVGMRPQWLTASPLIEQLLSVGGQASGLSVEEVRREMAGVDTIIIASKRTGGQPLVLARAADVVRATKAERDSYRYVDPDTILVGDWNETNAAMRRLFSQDAVSAEATMAGRVAAWSDVWLVMDPTAIPGTAAQLAGVTKITVGLAMRDGMTLEAWFDTPSAFAAKTLAARLQKNPRGTPFFGQVGSESPVVEQRDNSVRLYARVAANQGSGSAASNPSAQEAPVRVPALAPVARSKAAEVKAGMDRPAVEALLGKPHSVMAIQGSDEAIETLIYDLDSKETARVRLVSGKVVSVQFVE